MNSVKSIFIVVALGLCLICTSSCKGKSGQKDSKESRLVQRFKQPFPISHCPKQRVGRGKMGVGKRTEYHSAL